MKKKSFAFAMAAAALLSACATTQSKDVTEQLGPNAMVRTWDRRCERLARTGTAVPNADWGGNSGSDKAAIDRDIYRMLYYNCRREGI